MSQTALQTPTQFKGEVSRNTVGDLNKRVHLDLKYLQSEIVAIQGQISALQQEMGTVVPDSQLTAVQNQVTALQGQLNALQNQLNAIQQSVGNSITFPHQHPQIPGLWFVQDIYGFGFDYPAVGNKIVRWNQNGMTTF